MMTAGQDRRDTGSHYTPKLLTEAIVKETLEPLVYEGPSVGKPRAEWQLKSSGALLNLKICEPAMGSGSFLVQVCRWLGDRVIEAWHQEEASGAVIDVDGQHHENRHRDVSLCPGLQKSASLLPGGWSPSAVSMALTSIRLR